MPVLRPTTRLPTSMPWVVVGTLVDVLRFGYPCWIQAGCSTVSCAGGLLQPPGAVGVEGGLEYVAGAGSRHRPAAAPDLTVLPWRAQLAEPTSRRRSRYAATSIVTATYRPKTAKPIQGASMSACR